MSDDASQYTSTSGKSPDGDRAIVKSTDQARQGVTGHNVRFVLVISLGAAVLFMALVGFAFFH